MFDLNKIKEFADRTWSGDGEVVAKHPDRAVTNPWIDKSGRFPLTDEGAVKEWGLATVLDYCVNAMEAIDKKEADSMSAEVMPETDRGERTFTHDDVWLYSVTAYNDDLPEGLIACSAAFSEKEARKVTKRWIHEFNDPELIETFTFKLRGFRTGATGFDLNSFCDAVEIDPFEDDSF